LLFARWLGRRNMHILMLKSNKNLDTLAPLLSSGALKPVIDGPYDFDELPRLIRRFGEGFHTGKVVVRVAAEGA